MLLSLEALCTRDRHYSKAQSQARNGPKRTVTTNSKNQSEHPQTALVGLHVLPFPPRRPLALLMKTTSSSGTQPRLPVHVHSRPRSSPETVGLVAMQANTNAAPDGRFWGLSPSGAAVQGFPHPMQATRPILATRGSALCIPPAEVTSLRDPPAKTDFSALGTD